MVGELRDQALGHVPERPVELKRSGEPFTDPLEQADPVEFALAAPPHRLAREDHDPVDGAGRVPQRNGLSPDEDSGGVGLGYGECAFPDMAAEHPLGQFGRLDDIRFVETERKDSTVSGGR